MSNQSMALILRSAKPCVLSDRQCDARLWSMKPCNGRAVPPPTMLIGGQWVSAEADATFASSNPATGAVLGYAPAAGAAETTRAVDAAHHAFAGWSRRPAAERGRILTAVADLLLERRDLL